MFPLTRKQTSQRTQLIPGPWWWANRDRCESLTNENNRKLLAQMIHEKSTGQGRRQAAKF
jgi:hypothetical protein